MPHWVLSFRKFRSQTCCSFWQYPGRCLDDHMPVRFNIFLVMRLFLYSFKNYKIGEKASPARSLIYFGRISQIHFWLIPLFLKPASFADSPLFSSFWFPFCWFRFCSLFSDGPLFTHSRLRPSNSERKEYRNIQNQRFEDGDSPNILLIKTYQNISKLCVWISA